MSTAIHKKTIKTIKRRNKYHRNTITKRTTRTKRTKRTKKKTAANKKIKLRKFSKKKKTNRRGGVNGVKRKQPEPSIDFVIDKSLSVEPNEDESQWESYQSVFASIMNATDNPPSAYVKLLQNKGVELTDKQPILRASRSTVSATQRIGPRLIYFKEPPPKSKDPSTHFIAYLNGEEKNPYWHYQAKSTQGFCQMFAYFLVMDDTAEFIDIGIKNQQKKIDKETFDNLALNSKLCAQKSLDLLRSEPEIYQRFKEQFEEIMQNDDDRDDAGFKRIITVEKYIEEFTKLNSNINNIKDYIVDQPLEGWSSEDKTPQKVHFMPTYR